jgi:maltose O-acetyltransferase
MNGNRGAEKSFIHKLIYLVYTIFLKNTPEDYRPYALFFPFLRKVAVRFYTSTNSRNVLRVKSGAEVSPYVILGDNVELGSKCVIQSNTVIGNDVIMGPNVRIYTRNHIMNGETLYRESGKIQKEVKVGSNVWIGESVIILPGVEIHDNAVIGAGSVVTKSVSNGCLYAGNPAKYIKRVWGES